MQSPEQRKRHVRSKLERAHFHLETFWKEHDRYFASNPIAVEVKIDVERRPVYFISRIDPIPDCLQQIAGDAIQNLMGALDHLAYQIICNDTMDKPPRPREIYFPIEDSVKKYNASKGRKLNGAALDSIEAIDRIRPYRGGNDTLWRLYRLNNIEKHRLLLDAAPFLAGIDLMRFTVRRMEKDGVDKEIIKTLEENPTFFREVSPDSPLRLGFQPSVGDEILRDQVDTDPDDKLKFRFRIALREREVIETPSFPDLLFELQQIVIQTVNELMPLLDRRCP